MDLRNMSNSDKELLKLLEIQGLTTGESISLITNRVYFLNYKDRNMIRNAVRLIGNNRKDTIINEVQSYKRKTFFTELHNDGLLL